MTVTVKASTATEMRDAIVQYLETQAYNHGQRLPLVKRKGDKAELKAMARAYEDAARFIRDLVIEQ